MIAIVIFGVGLGAVLGSHFKIFVLGPAMLFAAAATLAVDFVRDVSPSTIVLAIVAIGIAAIWLSRKCYCHRVSQHAFQAVRWQLDTFGIPLILCSGLNVVIQRARS